MTFEKLTVRFKLELLINKREHLRIAALCCKSLNLCEEAQSLSARISREILCKKDVTWSSLRNRSDFTKYTNRFSCCSIHIQYSLQRTYPSNHRYTSIVNIIFVTPQVRRRRPDTRLNLQYDKLYVNNVAYWFNEDTQEIELVTPDTGDTESQVRVGGVGENICVLSKYFRQNTFADRDEGGRYETEKTRLNAE